MLSTNHASRLLTLALLFSLILLLTTSSAFAQKPFYNPATYQRTKVVTTWLHRPDAVRFDISGQRNKPDLVKNGVTTKFSGSYHVTEIWSRFPQAQVWGMTNRFGHRTASSEQFAPHIKKRKATAGFYVMHDGDKQFAFGSKKT
jgi:hypothetical protein